MKSSLRFLIVIAILLVTFGLPVALQQLFNPNSTPTTQITPTPEQTEIVMVDDLRILSIPPEIVPAGSTFMYKMVVASVSGDEITFKLIEKPDWMSWEEKTQQLIGTVPPVGGVFSVTIRATTLGGAIQDQTFTVTIDEQEVKGAKTVGLWKDPFHPNLADVQIAEAPYLSDYESSEEQVLGVTSMVPITDTGVGEPSDVAKLLDTKLQRWSTSVPGGTSTVIVGLILGALIIGGVLLALFTKSSQGSKLPKGIVIERGSR